VIEVGQVRFQLGVVCKEMAVFSPRGIKNRLLRVSQAFFETFFNKEKSLCHIGEFHIKVEDVSMLFLHLLILPGLYIDTSDKALCIHT
jgi:hypothetical protein